MAIKLRKQASGSVANPPASHLAFFVDQNGLPSLKDSDGTVTPAVSVDGSPLSLLAGSAPPSEALKVKLYSQTILGVTEFFVEDDTGALIQITRQGVLASIPHINWKGGTPGNPYIAGDTATAAFGDIVMVNVADPDIVTINLPAITAASGAQLVQIRNLVDKKGPAPGIVLVTPGVSDTIETFSTGEAVFPSSPIIHMSLESDGVGRWNNMILGGGPSLWTVPGPI